MAGQLPRVYGLDIVVPVLGKPPHRPVVVDVNGDRSSLLHAHQRFKDTRLDNQVLSLIAEAGGGTIFSPILRSAPAICDKFSLSALLSASPDSVGINRVADAYVPFGPEFDLSDEYRTAKIARALGIQYTTVFADWSEADRGFRLSVDHEDIGLLDNWDPGDSAIWPYSWDRRIFPFPDRFRVKELLSHYQLTTNKLLLASFDAEFPAESLAMPITHSFGFIENNSERLSRLATEFGSSSLAIVKPAQGRRSFGVFVTPTNRLNFLAQEIGISASRTELERGRKILAASSLWGCFPEACTVIQPYIQSVMRRHPITRKLHSTVYRATVIAKEGSVRCLDITCILAKMPYDDESGTIERLSLIQDNDIANACIDPQPDVATVVTHVAEQFVTRLEGIVEEFSNHDEVSLIGWEALKASSFADQTHDTAVLPAVEEAWSNSKALLSFFRTSDKRCSQRLCYASASNEGFH
jgi:hypothetical protein